MAGGFKVKAAAVVLPTEDGSERYLYRSGAILPTRGFTAEGLKHAVSLDLIEKAELPKADGDEQWTAPAGEQSTPQGDGSQPQGESTAGDPSTKWNVEQLATFARDNSIDISATNNKTEAVEVLKAELAKRAGDSGSTA